jgi:hypothetical protein
MARNLILILEDNENRIRDFQVAVKSFGGSYHARIWMDAPTMISEVPFVLDLACIISLDHDLNPQPDVTTDAGTGLEVAEFIASYPPLCPELIHSTNYEKA